MQPNTNRKKCTPTYVITNTDVVRIDCILDMIDDCIQAVDAGRFVQLPTGLYSDIELAEYEAHLESIAQHNLASQETEF